MKNGSRVTTGVIRLSKFDLGLHDALCKLNSDVLMIGDTSSGPFRYMLPGTVMIISVGGSVEEGAVITLQHRASGWQMAHSLWFPQGWRQKVVYWLAGYSIRIGRWAGRRWGKVSRTCAYHDFPMRPLFAGCLVHTEDGELIGRMI